MKHFSKILCTLTLLSCSSAQAHYPPVYIPDNPTYIIREIIREPAREIIYQQGIPPHAHYYQTPIVPTIAAGIGGFLLGTTLAPRRHHIRHLRRPHRPSFRPRPRH